MLRLICFPCAGGAAAVFRRWSRFLPGTIELCGIELPGRGLRQHEPLITDMNLMLNFVMLALQSHLDVPTVFFGHSMGAIVCFEVTRRLRRQGLPQPLHLFVSACHAPQNSAKGEPLSGLSNRELIQRLHCMDGTPAEMLEDEDFVRRFIPVLRSDLHMADNYKYQPELPLDLPIWALGGTEDSEVQAEELHAWRLQTHCSFRRKMFAGGHFYFRSAERDFIRALSERLESLAASSRNAASEGLQVSHFSGYIPAIKRVPGVRPPDAGNMMGNRCPFEEK